MRWLFVGPFGYAEMMQFSIDQLLTRICRSSSGGPFGQRRWSLLSKKEEMNFITKNCGILEEESSLSFFEVFGWSAVLSYYELKLCFLGCGEDSLLAVSSGGC